MHNSGKEKCFWKFQNPQKDIIKTFFRVKTEILIINSVPFFLFLPSFPVLRFSETFKKRTYYLVKTKPW